MGCATVELFLFPCGEHRNGLLIVIARYVGKRATCISGMVATLWSTIVGEGVAVRFGSPAVSVTTGPTVTSTSAGASAVGVAGSPGSEGGVAGPQAARIKSVKTNMLRAK